MKSLEKTINYKFKNKELLKLAFMHSSYKEEVSETLEDNNERLEFLGDSVLGCAMTYLLYIQYPYKSEGELSKVKSYLVGEPSLALVADELSLGEHLLLGAGEEKHGGRLNRRLLSSTFEAIVGAIFLDSDYSKAENFVEFAFKNMLKDINSIDISDHKSELQELMQKNEKITPTYRVVGEEGPAHSRRFSVEVLAEKNVIGSGQGKSKKEAEQKAAQVALKKISESSRNGL